MENGPAQDVFLFEDFALNLFFSDGGHLWYLM